jgi:cyclase
MKKKRIIPVILYRKGYTDQGKQFSRYKNMGHLADTFTRFSQWGADELIVLDISGSVTESNNKRSDVIHKGSADTDFISALANTSKNAFMPLAVGGGISTLRDIEVRLNAGADKIVLNSIVLRDPTFLSLAAREFGSQCIVVSVNFRKLGNEYQLYKSENKEFRSFMMFDTLKMIEDSGAGEVLLTDVERDGMKTGYNIPAMEQASRYLNIPVIACGGVGKWEDFYDAFIDTQVDGVAAANIFFHSDQSIFLAHDFLFKRKVNVRSPELVKRGW